MMERFAKVSRNKTSTAIAALPLIVAVAGCASPASPLAGMVPHLASNGLPPDQPPIRQQARIPETDPRAQHVAAPQPQPGPPVTLVSADRDDMALASAAKAELPLPTTTPAASSPQPLAGLASRPIAPALPRSRQSTATAEPRTPAPGKVHRIRSANFQQAVLRADQPVLVDFYADWCGPCRQLAPILDQLARETPDAKVVKVNIDDSRQLAARYRVRSVPTIMVFKDGQVAARHTGLADRRTLRRLLARPAR